MSTKKSQVKKYLIDYLKNRVPGFKILRNKMKCPFHHLHSNQSEELTANIFPEGSNNLYCFAPECGKLGNIVDLYRRIDLDGNTDITDTEIIDMIIDEFKIKINDDIDKLFEKYERLGFDCVPVAKDIGQESSYGKASYIETEWEKKSHKSRSEWEEWIDAQRNIGDKTGKLSGHLILDFDFVESKLKKKVYSGQATQEDLNEAKKQWEIGYKNLQEKIPYLDNTTLQQKTFGGIHYFYIYDEVIPKTTFDYEGIHIDVESEGGQVVVEPSIVGGQNRQIIGDQINPLSKELKNFLLKYCLKPEDAEIIESQIDGELDEEGFLIGLEGKCNTTFVKMGAILSKFLLPQDVQDTLFVVNTQLLSDPMPKKDIILMCNQIRKYRKNDNEVLTKKVYQFMQKHEEATVQDLKECLNATRNEIKEVLAYLIKEDKVFKQRSLYKIINTPEWKMTFVDDIKILPYKVAFFYDYAILREGDMICIAAEPGIGKTHIAMNFIKNFVDQGLCPKYYGSESKSRFLKIGMELGLKENQYGWDTGYEPEKIELLDNDITILDWVWPENLAETANLYKLFQKQLDKHNGLLIVFSQLRDDGKFYAETQLKMFASVAAKYMYTTEAGQKNSKKTIFQVEKIRESKTNIQYITVPTQFNDDKTITLRK